MAKECDQKVSVRDQLIQEPVGYWRRAVAKINEFENSGGPKVGYFYLMLAHLTASLGALFIQKLNTLPVYQLVYSRGICAFVMSWFVNSTQNIEFYTKTPSTNKKLISRGLISFFGNSLWMYGIQNMPLSEAVTLIQTGPVFSGLFAMYYLKEKFDITQGITMVMSLFGVLLVVKPPFLFGSSVVADSGDQNKFLGGICCLLVAVISGAVYSLVRDLRNKCHGQTTVHYTCTVSALVTPVFIFSQGVTTPTMRDIAYLLIMVVLMTASQSLTTRGLKFSAAGKSSILGYSQILFSFIIDILSNRPLDLLSVLGASSICSCVFMIFLEKKKS